MHNNRGQVIFEFALIISIVALGLGLMQVYLRRGIQAGIKIAADEIGGQEDYIEDPYEGSLIESRMHRQTASTSRLGRSTGGLQTTTEDERNTVLSGSNISYSDWERDDD